MDGLAVIDEAAAYQQLLSIPADVIARILLKLNIKDICSCASASNIFSRVVAEDRRVWWPLCENRWGMKTSVQDWVKEHEASGSSLRPQTPVTASVSTTYRDLYRQLQNLDEVEGFWSGQEAGPLGSLYVFRWTTCCLQGVHLLGTDSSRPTLCATPFLSLGPDFPCNSAEVLDQRHCILRQFDESPASHTSFSAAVAASAAASPGLHTARDTAGLLGSSPERHFGQELELFMSGSVQKPRSNIKKGRRPGGGGTRGVVANTHHLLRLQPMQPSRKHPLAGLWMGVYGLHGVEVVSVEYDFSGAAAKVVAIKVTGDPNVPRGKETWIVSASPLTPPFNDAETALLANHSSLPDNGDVTVIAIHTGVGRIANAGFQSPSWIEGRLWVYSNGGIAFLWLHPFNSLVDFDRVHAEKLPQPSPQPRSPRNR